MAGTIGIYGHGRSDLGWLTRQLLVMAMERLGQPPAVFVETINHRLGRQVVSLPMLGLWGRGVGQPPADVWVTAVALAGADMTALVQSLCAEGTPQADVSELRSALEVALQQPSQAGSGNEAHPDVRLDEERVVAVVGGGRPVDGRMGADLAELTRHYCALYDTMAPSSLLPVMDGHHRLLCGLLTGAADSRLRRDLAATLGETAMMLGWLCFLVEDRRQAQAHWESAGELAAEHGDQALGAHVLIARSQLISCLPHGGRGGDPALAIALLDRAEERSRRQPGLRAWALARRAEEHAAAGDAEASARDLAEAERELGRVEGRLVLPGPRTAVDLAGFRGNCAALLGSDRRAAQEAAEVLKRAVAEAPPERTTFRAVLLNDLGSALAQLGEVEAACAAFEESVELALQTGAAVHVQRVAGASRGLARWRTAASVQRLHARLLHLD
jgi:tetratricopeptide (TPR) repeat protein